VIKAVLRIFLRVLIKPLFSSWVPISVQRLGSKLAGSRSNYPGGTEITRLEMNGVQALQLRTASAEIGKAVLLLHGGGYILPATASHRSLASHLSEAARACVYLPDYRLAPEYPYPAALNDALAAYRWLLQQYDSTHLVIAGDSAGANLALATVLAIREAGLPLPAALVLISPWVDLTHSGDTIHSLAKRDPVLDATWLQACAELYACGTPLVDRRISPLFGDLQGLPPMMIHVGTEEILFSDSESLARRAEAAGVDVSLQRFEGMWHDFQLLPGLLAEADTSIAQLGNFVSKQWRV
jgi:epsilon-lactone hydrolase